MNSTDTVKEIIELYRQKGNETYGEKVSMLQHMTQCAELALSEGFDDEVVLAAFLHDIGHFIGQERMGQNDGLHHDSLGAKYLASKGFSTRICVLVGGHVDAKRYLTLVDPLYYQELSEASKKSLELQGGRMTPAEAMKFQESPYFELNLKLRRWDEASKNPNKKATDLTPLEDLMERHLSERLELV